MVDRQLCASVALANTAIAVAIAESLAQRFMFVLAHPLVFRVGLMTCCQNTCEIILDCLPLCANFVQGVAESLGEGLLALDQPVQLVILFLC